MANSEGRAADAYAVPANTAASMAAVIAPATSVNLLDSMGCTPRCAVLFAGDGGRPSSHDRLRLGLVPHWGQHRVNEDGTQEEAGNAESGQRHAKETHGINPGVGTLARDCHKNDERVQSVPALR